MKHFTREEIIATPGYCQEGYERQIGKLEAKIAEAIKIIDQDDGEQPLGVLLDRVKKALKEAD